MYPSLEYKPKPTPWNKGKLSGQKRPLKLQEIWAIRIRLQLAGNSYDLALFNLAIDSKLRACDLVKLKVTDVAQGGRVQSRARVIQQETKQPVQFEITVQPTTSTTSTRWMSKTLPRPETLDLALGCTAHQSRLRLRWLCSD